MYLCSADIVELTYFRQRLGLFQMFSLSDPISSADWSMFGSKNAWINIIIHDWAILDQVTAASKHFMNEKCVLETWQYEKENDCSRQHYILNLVVLQLHSYFLKAELLLCHRDCFMLQF